MIYITQLIYIKQGQTEVFNQFEAIAIPIIAKYNGKLLFRIRPSEEVVVERNIDRPYEVHLIEFPSDAALHDFMQDEERQRFLHLKEQSIELSILIKGDKM